MNLVFESVADLLMLAHAGLSLFLIVGLMLIITGMIFGWRWTRERRFRGLHRVPLDTVLMIGGKVPRSSPGDERRNNQPVSKYGTSQKGYTRPCRDRT
jgi:hypothetical protein